MIMNYIKKSPRRALHRSEVPCGSFVPIKHRATSTNIANQEL